MSHWLVLAWSHRPWLKNWLLQASTHVIPCLCGGYEVEVTMEAGSGCGAWLDKTWQPSLANERFPCREGESNSIKLFGFTYCNRQRNTLLPFISADGQRNIDCWKSQHATTSSIFVFYCSEIVYHSLTQNEQHCEIVLQTYAMNNIYIYIYIQHYISITFATFASAQRGHGSGFKEMYKGFNKSVRYDRERWAMLGQCVLVR